MQDNTVGLSAGDKITCPNCHEETIVKIKSRIDDWTQTGMLAVCALCRYELQDLTDDANLKGNGKEQPASDSAERLAAFLGEPQEAARKTPSPFLQEVHEFKFCRDCRFFCNHPFGDMCLKHQRRTGSMEDCADYETKVDDQDSDNMDAV